VFVSHPQHRLNLEQNHTEPGALHWRVMELAMNAPWFLVTLVDGHHAHDRIPQTVCVAWETDLAHLLRCVPQSSVLSVMCMSPATLSSSAPWTCGEIYCVWSCSSATADEVICADAEGARVESGPVPTHDGPVSTKLLWRKRSAPLGPRDGKRRTKARA
jgi:hypothetical protein